MLCLCVICLMVFPVKSMFYPQLCFYRIQIRSGNRYTFAEHEFYHFCSFPYIRKHVYFSFFCLFSSDIQRVCFQGYLSTVYILNGVHFYFYVESFVESHVYTFCFPFIKFSRQNPAIQIKNNLAALYML